MLAFYTGTPLTNTINRKDTRDNESEYAARTGCAQHVKMQTS